MSLGSAASLVEEPFPFSHTIRVESQSKNRSDYDLHHPKSHHPYMRKRERLWRLLQQHPCPLRDIFHILFKERPISRTIEQTGKLVVN